MITSVFSLTLCKTEITTICIFAAMFDAISGVEYIQ